MDLYATVRELIDLRSFSNLWYWIGLAVVWSSASHWVLGVPLDMIQRAKKRGGEAMDDLQSLTRISCNRILYISSVSGLWLLGFSCFVLTGLAMLGFYYNVEFAQAVFLLLFPMSIVGLISISTARLIDEKKPQGLALVKQLMRHRIYVQLLGVLSIFTTAMWGMAQNMNYSVLFN
ncbi:hypothetical protein [Falsihalocynthiibacter arcticus]|uniref:Component of SufBCD complex n=1 Tax=Falsihalocynthiibacter arcticus TaxID=1579316 RepID=A0A126V3H0_9RHOB|nr:hypothetical protein [Falsihalocynthiibacter arcticus]AML52697.1 component of SufBCD complex [Falsihalocynthiibacter arcticus]